MIHFSSPYSNKKYYPLDGQRSLKERNGIFSFQTISLTLLLVVSILTLSLCLSLVSKFKQWNGNEIQSTEHHEMNPIYNYNTKNDGSNDNEQPSTHIRKPEESHTPGFKEAARYLSAFIDTSVDPCEDFYQYTCGGFLKNNLSNAFAVVQRDDDNVLIEELSKVNVEDLTAVRQARWVYDACMSTNSSKFDGSEVLQVISGFTRAAGIIFPLLNPTKSVPELTQEQLAKSFALMSNIMGVSSLMIAETETNWKDPVGENPYLLYLDQASLSFDTSFYEKGTFEKVKTGLKRTMTTEISKIAKAAGVNIDAKTLDEDVEDMIVMESLIGRTMNLPQEARRKFAPEWNPVTVRDAQNRWPFMDWKVFLNDLAMDVPEVQTLLTNADFKMICKSPRFFDGFSDAIANNDISQRTLQNYLMYRLVSSQSDFINPTKTKEPHFLSNGVKRLSTIQQYVKGMSNYSCTSMLRSKIPFATGRLFVEAYTDAVRNKITERLMEMVDNVVLGFQTMVDSLPWMSEQVKQAVRSKIRVLEKNVVAPEWIYDDALFDKYYESLDIEESDSFFIMKMKLARFEHRKGLEALLNTKQDRKDMSACSAATVNAWYQASANAINLPMSTLRAPFFDPEWPISLNYGGLGSVMGHELTHGFDDGGVQWDGIGKLSPWMTENRTIEGFNRMRKCIVDQYDGICPLPASFAPSNCVNGFQTQGENIADNGGLRAAYLAYKNLINLKGPEKRLPGDLMSQYTHDQLFFLGFANIWCTPEMNDAAINNQILIDPHSPDKFRVPATVKNFPAFQQAFNCPVDSPMSPKNHCNVWVGDNKNNNVI